ncbi:hypothetical protein MRX96_015225 [Rhipicephalus microplus]
MTDYRMDDEASDVSDNDEEDFGWQVAAGRRSRAKKSSKAANAMPCNSQESSAHGDAKPTQEPQKPLTLSEFLEIQAPLATPEEQLLQVERSAGELRIRSAWCHAGCWDHLGR